MPVILKETTQNGLSIGVWEITETEKTLCEKAHLSKEEEATLNSFKNKGRRLQWLAVRALLCEFLHPRPTVAYQENGKPFFIDSKTELSISHSGKHAAIALSSSIIPGIDVEEIHPKILKIANRFTNEQEKAYLKDETLTEQLCVIWAAKEVLYKTHPHGMLSFRENLFISEFKLSDKFEFEGTLKKDGTATHYSLIGERLKDYILVYTKEG